MSPQLLLNQKYTSKSDIWSLGIILFEMLYGALKYLNIELILIFIKI